MPGYSLSSRKLPNRKCVALLLQMLETRSSEIGKTFGRIRTAHPNCHCQESLCCTWFNFSAISSPSSCRILNDRYDLQGG